MGPVGTHLLNRSGTPMKPYSHTIFIAYNAGAERLAGQLLEQDPAALLQVHLGVVGVGAGVRAGIPRGGRLGVAEAVGLLGHPHSRGGCLAELQGDLAATGLAHGVELAGRSIQHQCVCHRAPARPATSK